MKKILKSLLWILVLAALCIPLSMKTEAAVSGTNIGDNVTWNFNDSAAVVVFGTGAMYNYDDETNLPFYDWREVIWEVVIEDGVTSIGDYAFYGCYNLTYVTIPDSVQTIGKNAFAGCSNIRFVQYAGTQAQWNSISIGSNNGSLTGASRTYGSVSEEIASGTAGDNITWTLDDAGVLTISGTGVMPSYFSYTDVSEAPWYGLHESILKVVIEDGVESVSNSAFCGCEKLTSVTIPDSVQTIDDHAFRSCADLKTVMLGTGLKKIGDGAFYQCTSLSKVQYAGTRVQWNSIVIGEDNECLTDVAPMKPAGIRVAMLPNKMAYVLNETLDTTGLQVELFYNDGASEVVTGFKVSGFSSKTAGAKTVTVTYQDFATTFTVSVLNLIARGTAGKNITWTLDGSGMLTISGTGAMYDFDYYLDEDRYPHCSSPFYDLRKSILKVVIEDGVTSVGSYAFYECEVLTSVTIPAGVQTIGEYAFYECEVLTSVTIPAGVQTIGEYAFYYCKALTSVTLPDSLQTIRKAAFRECSKINLVRYAGTEAQWNSITIDYGNADYWDLYLTNAPREYRFDEAIKGIRIVTLPNKTEYLLNQTLKTTGLQVKVTFKDGTTAVNSGGFTVSGFSSKTAGNKTVTVTYKGFTATFTVSVLDLLARGTAGDDITWTLDGNGILTISGTGDMDHYYYYVGSYDHVVTHYTPWYDYRLKISEVVIEDGVESIGWYAFASCTNLKTVTLGAGLKEIGSYAFYECTSLSVVRHAGTYAQWQSVPKGSDNGDLTSSSHWWLDQGKWHTGIRIAAKPNKTEYLLNETLDTTGLQVEAVYSDETTKKITDYEISGFSSTTSGLKVVAVKYKGNIATFNVSVLNMFGSGTAGENITWKLDSKGVLTISGTGAMPNYADTYKVPWYSKRENVLKVAIEDGVTSVGSYAFYNCACLTSVAIPDSVQTISNNAFGNCTSLSTVEYTGTQTQWNSIAIGSGNECLTGAVLSALPTGIRFTLLPGKSEYLLNETLDTKGLQVQAVYSDGTAKVISDFEISGFSSSTVGEKTVTVTWRGFTATFTVTVLDVPTGENITWTLDDAGVLTISGTGAMKNYTKDSEVPWYSNCTSISKVVIEDGVTSVGDYAFYGCTALTSVTLPDSVEIIGKYAFYNCYMMKELTIPDSVTSIGESAFRSCVRLVSVDFGSGVQTIGAFAFRSCTKLTTVTIPKSVKTIKYNAFENCTSLSKVQYTGTQTQWNSISIGSNNGSLTGASREYRFGVSIAGIRITATPDKTAYLLNETLDTTGLQVETVYSDETTEVISTGFEVSGFSSDTFGDKTVTVTYEGYTATFTVSVIDAIALGTAGKNITWILDKAGVLTISGSGVMTNYTKASAVPWNSKCTSITKVVIEDGVQSVGNYAFYGCTALTAVSVPDGVETVGDYAFYNCTGLTAVTFSDSVKEIGKYAFYNCYLMKELTIPDSVKTIGVSAFRSCVRLVSVDFGSGVQTIGCYAFRSCTKLATVTIPRSVKTILYNAFENCTSLSKVQYTGTQAQWNSIAIGLSNECLTGASREYRFGMSIAGIRITETPDKTAYLLNETLDTTGLQVEVDYADGATEVITNFEISGYGSDTAGEKTVTVAYKGFTDSFTVSVFGPLSGTAGENVTWELGIDGVLTVSGSGTMTDYTEASQVPWYDVRKSVLQVVIKDGVQSIGTEAFNGCTKLASVSLGKGLQSIGARAFYGCNALTEVVYTGTSKQWSAVTIGTENTKLAGVKCLGVITGIRVATLPDRTEYDVSEKLDITGLQVEIAYADGTTYIVSTGFEVPAFTGTSPGTKTITVTYEGFTATFTVEYKAVMWSYTVSDDGKVTITGVLDTRKILEIPTTIASMPVVAIADKAFYGNQNITQVIIPEGVETIGSQAFYNCAYLTSVTLSDSVKTMGESVFRSCVRLKSVDLGNGLQAIGDYAFRSCSNLTEVIMGDSVQSIGIEAFIYCKNLAEITLGDNVTTIGDNAFMYCTKLKTVDLGESVKNIGHSAFRNCTSLELVVLPKTVSALDAYAFAGCTALSCITIPVKVTSIDEWIFGGCNNLKYVLYGGTEAKRKEMLIDGMNEALLDATWYYNVSAEEETSILGIQIVAMPDKTEYAAGETLDVTGLQLEAVYSDGTVKTVGDGFEISGFSSDTAGEQMVTVTYEGVTTTFTVSVTEEVACGQIIVDTSAATAGKTVKVTIALKGNPGLISATLRVHFDAKVLTLTEVTDGGILGVTSHKPTFSCPYTLTWVNDTATTDFTADGIIVTLTFTVAEDAEPGNYPITVTYDYDGYDIYNANAQKVKFTAVNGGVQVLGYIAGDVNNDGTVNNLDRLALTRYLAGWEGYDEDTLNLDAADVNGDGAVNNLDRTVLTRYLADWDGYETLPYTG